MKKVNYSLLCQFGVRVEKLRESKHITRPELCKKLLIDEKTYRNWIHKEKASEPTLSHLVKLCELLDCDLDYLAGRISGTTHDNAFICTSIGISEKAVINLKKAACIDHDQSPDRNHVFGLDALSDILEKTDFEKIDNIFSMIEFYAMCFFQSPENDIIEVKYHDGRTEEIEDFTTARYNGYLLSKLEKQACLQDLIKTIEEMYQ